MSRRYEAGPMADNVFICDEGFATMPGRRLLDEDKLIEAGSGLLQLTQDHGACFAVLNMANAYVPGAGKSQSWLAIFTRGDAQPDFSPAAHPDRS